MDFNAILTNFAYLRPCFHPQLYPHSCLSESTHYCLQPALSRITSPTISRQLHEGCRFPVFHKAYYDYYL
jgi:hypothetical protein